MTFSDWLRGRRHDQTPVGDLARDVLTGRYRRLDVYFSARELGDEVCGCDRADCRRLRKAVTTAEHRWRQGERKKRRPVAASRP